jgi:hypothetical protein
MDRKEAILQAIRDVAAENGEPVKGELHDDLPVFDTGLDSLGFAILVARLEDTLGFDPFVAMAEPVYPATVGEFLAIYLRHEAVPHAA